jgi:serine phosphatase RsbU (regulator of sigma subunit)
METGEPLLSEDASQDSKFDVSASVADLRIRSMICAPLLDSEGKSIGALQIDSLNSRFRFSAEDLDLLASVAAQAGIAIRNAQLHEFALHQATEKAKVEEDLLRAWQVQQAFLPNTQPALPGFHFFNYYQPATYIGGDYYDYIPLSNDRVAVVVADVVGHGVAAAMLMAKLAAECRFCLASEPDPALAITRLNREICSLTTERFITFLLTVYNPRERQMTIVNAGHMAPIILRSNGEIIEPGEEESGIVLGVDGDWNYDAISVDLDPGDTVVMYTDGINEAHNPANAQFGIERIRERLKTEKDHSTIGSGIIKSVTEFMAGAPQGDDMCLVVLHRGSMAE